MLENKILELMADHKERTLTDVAKKVKAEERVVNTYLRRLVRDGKLVSAEIIMTKTYRVPYSDEIMDMMSDARWRTQNDVASLLKSRHKVSVKPARVLMDLAYLTRGGYLKKDKFQDTVVFRKARTWE